MKQSHFRERERRRDRERERHNTDRLQRDRPIREASNQDRDRLQKETETDYRCFHSVTGETKTYQIGGGIMLFKKLLTC